MPEPVLDVRDLRVSFRTEAGIVRAVDGLSFQVGKGEVLGIVGESGSGKSVTVMTIMRLIRDPNAILEGQVLFGGRDLMALSQREMRSVRGREVGMIFQDPMTALTPVYTVGWQIAEQLRAHQTISRRAARVRAAELLAEVGIPNAAQRSDDYPHQFSGGMRQRVMIAMALSCNPKLLLADEPTTALDVTIQAQILEIMARLSRELGTAVVVITHNLGVVARYADRVNVMYAGKVVEMATASDLYANPRHPYTIGLLKSVPRLDQGKKDRLIPIEGVPPDLVHRPAGCAFAPRCAYKIDKCLTEIPPLMAAGDKHQAAWWVMPTIETPIPGKTGVAQESGANG